MSTRLANLKERCQLLLINYLTMEQNDLNNSHIIESEREFFNNIVAEKHPDLMIDVCDYWLN